MKAWAGRAVSAARAVVVTWLPAPCGKCGKTVTPEDRWAVGHIVPRWQLIAEGRHDEVWDPRMWRPEHRKCSDSSGQSEVIAKAKAEALRDAGVFSHATTPRESPPLPFSPRGAQNQALEIRAELRWTHFTQAPPSWVLPLPSDSEMSPPLAMTPVHPRAVGSFGLHACEWIENQFGQKLRPWQRLAICRALEHDDQGALVWRTVILSASRRSGKSIVLRGLACWRMRYGFDYFGEPTEIVHTGNDLAIVREIQRTSWRWAEESGWTITRANGKEQIETDYGDRWLARARSAVYGYSPNVAFADEAWDIAPEVIDDGLTPSLLERQSPQLWLVSTAHRRATSLMRKRIASALEAEDGSTLLLWWGVQADADPGDEAIWRAASPHWSEDRLGVMRSKYQDAITGQADPTADDPDPLQGFVAQYLNAWKLRDPRLQPGTPVIEAEAWDDLAEELPDRAPDTAAIESWFSDGVSLALAWRDGDRVIVSASDHQDMAGAVAALKASGFRGVTTVGSSLKSEPALKGVRQRAGEGRTAAAVQDLARLLSEDVLRHDGSAHLADQVTALRTSPGADGPRLVSKGRADAVKAALWAAGRARTVRKARILVPTV